MGSRLLTLLTDVSGGVITALKQADGVHLVVVAGRRSG